MTQFKISKKLKLILIGMLLGDANLQTFNNQTFRLRVLHSDKQFEYVEHKFNLFQGIIRTKILYSTEQRINKTYKKYYFNTVVSKSFKFYYDLFYNSEGKKTLPKLIHRYIEPISIAYWYMDDGSLKWKNRSKAVRICTDGFTKPEVLKLVSILNIKFNLNASIFRQRSRFRIYIPNNNYEFSNLISPFVIDSLKYKLP